MCDMCLMEHCYRLSSLYPKTVFFKNQYFNFSLKTVFLFPRITRETHQLVIVPRYKILCTLGSRYRNKFRYRDPLFAIHYRNVLVIGTNRSDNKYTKCLCNVLVIRTILSSDNEYVLIIGTNCSDNEYGWLYSLSEQFSCMVQISTLIIHKVLGSNFLSG